VAEQAKRPALEALVDERRIVFWTRLSLVVGGVKSRTLKRPTLSPDPGASRFSTLTPS
jgi:hypothetical protein